MDFLQFFVWILLDLQKTKITMLVISDFTQRLPWKQAEMAEIRGFANPFSSEAAADIWNLIFA